MGNELGSSLVDRAFAGPAAGAAAGAKTAALLDIGGLNVRFETSHGTVRDVEGVSYSVHPGEMVLLPAGLTHRLVSQRVVILSLVNEALSPGEQAGLPFSGWAE